jgi:hypothetical protein
MIWDTSIWRLGCSNRSKIRSAQKCYPCLRYVVSPMCPGWTLEELVEPMGFEPTALIVSPDDSIGLGSSSLAKPPVQRWVLDRDWTEIHTLLTASQLAARWIRSQFDPGT